MSTFTDAATDRRRFLFGGAALGAGALVAGCTGSGDEGNGGGDLVAQGNSPGADATGRRVTITHAPKRMPSTTSSWRPGRERTTSTSRCRRSRR